MMDALDERPFPRRRGSIQGQWQSEYYLGAADSYEPNSTVTAVLYLINTGGKEKFTLPSGRVILTLPDEFAYTFG